MTKPRDDYNTKFAHNCLNLKQKNYSQHWQSGVVYIHPLETTVLGWQRTLIDLLHREALSSPDHLTVQWLSLACAPLVGGWESKLLDHTPRCLTCTNAVYESTSGAVHPLDPIGPLQSQLHHCLAV